MSEVNSSHARSPSDANSHCARGLGNRHRPASLVKEEKRFARALTAHLLRFALSRELRPADALAVDAIVQETEKEGFRLKSLIREVIRSDVFLGSG